MSLHHVTSPRGEYLFFDSSLSTLSNEPRPQKTEVQVVKDEVELTTGE